METLNIIIKIIGLAIMAIGIVVIYDARKISEKRFSYQDRNNSTKILKITGFVVSIIGTIIVMLNINF